METSPLAFRNSLRSAWLSGLSPSESASFVTPSSCSCSCHLAVTKPARMRPTATAVIKSTKTVRPMVMNMTMTLSRGARMTRRRYPQSIISQPTFSKIPASAAWGIFSASGPRPITRARSTRACNAPEIGVRPPARTLTTVRIVAPAPGSPPISAEIMLPIPWPISSRFELWRVRVIESATSDVSRLSMEPRSANVIAPPTTPARRSNETWGMERAGSPVGTSPIIGAPENMKMLLSVPTISAARGGGM